MRQQDSNTNPSRAQQTEGFGEILRSVEGKTKRRLEHPRLLEESEGAHRRLLEQIERDGAER